MTSVVFTPDALREAAEQKSGHSDYGSDSYQTALEPLLYAIEHEAQLNETGQREIWGRIVAALANRLTVVAWEKANPGLANAAIEPPLVILGLPRTGSSILHETLAAAPDLRTPRIWEVRDYSLAHTVTDARSDQRVKDIEANIARYNARAQGYAAIHYEDAFVPIECLALTVLDLVTSQFSTIAWMPSYRTFLLSHDARETYRWHRRALRYFQANSPGVRWVLKAPMHALYIGALLETYPDAMIIQTHRDPLAVIGSLFSLYATLRQPLSDTADATGRASSDASYPARAIQKTVDYRRAHPELASRFHDVAFRDFMADHDGTLQRIYDYFGLPLTVESKCAMIDYLKHRPREKYGRHNYSLEEFGISEGLLRPLFAEYTKEYSDFL